MSYLDLIQFSLRISPCTLLSSERWVTWSMRS
jgi:hypothetical protein